MTVRELYNWCKAFKYKDAEVYLVKDWEQVDEGGNLNDLYRLNDITYQCVVVDMGMDFENVYEALLEVSDEQARATINKDGLLT